MNLNHILILISVQVCLCSVVLPLFISLFLFISWAEISTHPTADFKKMFYIYELILCRQEDKSIYL